MSTNEIVFDNVRVPAKNLLGSEGQGMHIIMQTLDISRTGVAAMATGVCQASLEAAIKYAGEREQFGKPIGSFQAIQFMLADMAMYTETARLLYLKAASLQDAKLPFKMLSSMAKAWAGDAAVKVSCDAIQVFGGYGYTKDYPVEKYYRDAKIMQIYEGTAPSSTDGHWQRFDKNRLYAFIHRSVTPTVFISLLRYSFCQQVLLLINSGLAGIFSIPVRFPQKY